MLPGEKEQQQEVVMVTKLARRTTAPLMKRLMMTKRLMSAIGLDSRDQESTSGGYRSSIEEWRRSMSWCSG